MKSKTLKKPGIAVAARDGVFAKLKAEKKKAITAVCLLLVMSFMWLKVFVGKSPQSAKATDSIEASSSQEFSSEPDEQGTEPGISYVELPRVEGRNDILTRDFFIFDNKGFSNGSVKEVQSISENNNDEELMRRISAKLTLEAIVMGDNPQAFINNKLLCLGDKLTIKEGSDVYVCEVTEIGETEVTIRCREGTVKLKILQSLEVLD